MLVMESIENEPQITADEYRFVNLDIQRSSEVYPKNDLLISPQRAQSSAISVTLYEKATTSRFRTQMTRIARIFTDPRASASSAQSAFYFILSAFICGLIKSQKTRQTYFIFNTFISNEFQETIKI